jgi:plastocyanin
MKTFLPGLMSASRKLSAWIGLYALLVLLALYLASCSATSPTPLKQSASDPAHSHRMTLSDHEFAPVDFEPQPGDTITIRNHSDISHSIYVTYPDGTMVNLGVQTPGTTVYWQVPADAKGEFVLQCWIHPIIRANLLINEAKTSSSAARSALPKFTRQEILDGRQNICSSRNRRA